MTAYRTILCGADGSRSSLRAVDRARAAGATDVDMVPVEGDVEGDAVDVIATLVHEREADLLVAGNRGLGSLAGRILGSVPASLSHRAACDVLIVYTTHGRESRPAPGTVRRLFAAVGRATAPRGLFSAAPVKVPWTRVAHPRPEGGYE